MAERLTTRFHGILVKEANVSKIQVITKLGQLEDIMEKYGIEGVEELDCALENKIEDISNPFLQGYVRAFFKDRLQYIETDRDTWKRACELACEDLQFFDYGNEKTEDGIIMKVDYFYQQAKKEGNDE